MKSNQRFITMATVIMAFVLLPFSVGAQDSKPVIRLGQYPGTVGNMHAQIAVEKGFCDTHGIKCQLVTVTSGPMALQTLLGKSMEVGMFVPEVAFGGIAKGADIQVVMGGYGSQPYALVVRSDISLPKVEGNPMAALKGLKGLKIGVPSRGSGAELHLVELLNLAGLKPTDVTIVAVGAPNTGYPALVVGKTIDAMINFPPLADMCNVGKTCTTVLDLSRGEGPPAIREMIGASVPMWMRRDYIEANPKVLDALQQAMLDTEKWMKDPANFDEVVAIYSKRIPLTGIANAQQILRTWLKSDLLQISVRLNRVALKAIHDYALRNKLIAEPIDLNRIVWAKAP